MLWAGTHSSRRGRSGRSPADPGGSDRKPPSREISGARRLWCIRLPTIGREELAGAPAAVLSWLTAPTDGRLPWPGASGIYADRITLGRSAPLTASAILCAIACQSTEAAGPRADDPGATEFFEKSIRPILAEKCQKCHGAGKTRGGLSLAGRALVLKGGDSGPAAVPGKPRESLIIEAVEQHGELKMPPEGKLATGEVDRLRRWIELDMPWPETHPGESAAPAAAPSTARRRATGGRSGPCGRRGLRRSRTPVGRGRRSTGSSWPRSRRGG